MAGTVVASTINNDTGLFSTQNAYLGIAKAWVQFAGASGTINGSFNVSSVTYISLGVWSVNFTTAMPNANYAAVLGSTDVQSNSTLNFMNIQSTNLPTTTACRMQCTPSGGGNGLANPTQVHCTIFSS